MIDMHDMQKETLKKAAAAASELQSAMETILSQLRGETHGPALPSLLEDLCLYAWYGEGHDYAIDRLHEAGTVEALLDGRFQDAPGNGLLSDENRDLIQKIINAAGTRFNLHEGYLVTIEGLAALANVSERTIRAATNSSNPNAIPITKSGHRTLIEPEHALAWLAGRRDFVQTRGLSDKPSAAALGTGAKVGERWKAWRESRHLPLTDLAAQLGWSAAETEIYASIESGDASRAMELTPGFWSRLAVHFEAEDPTTLAISSFRYLSQEHAEARLKAEFGRTT